MVQILFQVACEMEPKTGTTKLFFFQLNKSIIIFLLKYPKGIKTLLANGFISFAISGNSVFSNGPSNLLRNPPDYIIFNNWVFGNLISADE